MSCPAKSSPLVPRTGTCNEAYRMILSNEVTTDKGTDDDIDARRAVARPREVPIDRPEHCMGAQAVPSTTVAVSRCLRRVLNLSNLTWVSAFCSSVVPCSPRSRTTRHAIGVQSSWSVSSSAISYPVHAYPSIALTGLSCSSAIFSHPHTFTAGSTSHALPIAVEAAPSPSWPGNRISEPTPAAASEAATQTRTRGHASEPPRVR